MTQTKTREDYPDLYSYRAENLWKEVKEQEDIGYPLVISYFTPSGNTPITGKVFQPPSPEYKCECDIKECFTAIQDKMIVKSGQPRASMLKLKDYEIQVWAQLLDYLRFEYGSLGNRGNVTLTGAEWWLLFGNKNKKKHK